MLFTISVCESKQNKTKHTLKRSILVLTKSSNTEKFWSIGFITGAKFILGWSVKIWVISDYPDRVSLLNNITLYSTMESHKGVFCAKERKIHAIFQYSIFGTLWCNQASDPFLARPCIFHWGHCDVNSFYVQCLIFSLTCRKAHMGSDSIMFKHISQLE